MYIYNFISFDNIYCLNMINKKKNFYLIIFILLIINTKNYIQKKLYKIKLIDEII